MDGGGFPSQGPDDRPDRPGQLRHLPPGTQRPPRPPRGRPDHADYEPEPFHEIRNAEVEGGGPDPYGQGGVVGQNPTPAAINPDFALTGTVMDLPNRRTNYYQIEFSLEDLHRRRTVWDRMYAVKVAR